MTQTTEQAIAAHVAAAVAADLAGHLIVNSGTARAVLLHTEDAAGSWHGVWVALRQGDPAPFLSEVFPVPGVSAERSSLAARQVLSAARTGREG
jgi:hypothetical protein